MSTSWFLFTFFFFLNEPAPTEISPLPLHAALPIPRRSARRSARRVPGRRGSRAQLHAHGRRARHGDGRRVALAHVEVDHLPGRVRRLDRKSRSEEHTSELQSPCNLVCRLLLEKKKR